MNKSAISAALDNASTPDLATLAGVTLKRGRPSADLRDSLKNKSLKAIADKKVSIKQVKGAPAFVRGDAVISI